jgi:cell division septation protein DedD
MIRNLLIVAVLLPFSLAAQSQLSLYRLNATLPQANMLNPAFYPDHKVVIGLPVISSLYGSASTDGIAFRDVFTSSLQHDSLTLDKSGLPGKMRSTQKFRLSNAIQLFYLGIRGRRSYFSLGIHQISDTRLSYPGDVVGWGILGPEDPRYAMRSLSLDHLYGKSLAYNQISVSYARTLTEKLRVGVRLKYLMGIAAGESDQVDGSVRTSVDMISLNTSAVNVHTAGIPFFEKDDLTTADYVDYALKNSNRGVALDLGGTYQINERVSVSASLNDIGYIRWKDYTRSYSLNAVTYNFEGFDFLDYINDNSNASVEMEGDSLKNLYKFTETDGGSFRTALIGKLYAGVNYRLLKGNNVSALAYVDMVKGKIDASLGVAYNIQLGRALNAVVSVAYRDRTINNFGAGLVLKLGPLQLFSSTDRFNSLIYPARAGSADAHIGMNLVFGRKEKKNPDDVEKKEPEQHKPDTASVKEPVIAPQDSVQTIPATDSVSAPSKDTTIVKELGPAPQQDSVQKEIPITPGVSAPSIDTTTIKEPAPPATAAPVGPAPHKDEVVTIGNHPDEFRHGHYLIVGAFKNKRNARTHSNLLKKEGYAANFNYLSAKGYYYVYVFTSASDLDAVRAERDDLRAIQKHQFPNAWVLSVVKAAGE